MMRRQTTQPELPEDYCVKMAADMETESYSSKCLDINYGSPSLPKSFHRPRRKRNITYRSNYYDLTHKNNNTTLDSFTHSDNLHTENV